MTDFHTRLRWAIDRIGGDSELARRLETRNSTVSGWFAESRMSWPHGSIMVRLPEALAHEGKPLNGHWLLTGSGEPYMPPKGGYADGVRDERERIKVFLDEGSQ